MPEFGIRAWYHDLSRAPSAQPAHEIHASWPRILSAWTAVELDFAEAGIDLESGVLQHRTWRWLSLRIFGLVSSPNSRLYRTLQATTGTEGPHRVS